MSTVTTPSAPKVGFVSLGCPNDVLSKQYVFAYQGAIAGF